MNFRRALVLVALVACVAMLSAPSAHAQPNKPWKWIYGHFAAGIAMPQGKAGDALDDGWNISGGATFRKQNWPVAFVAELAYNDVDIKSEALIGEDEDGDPVRIADNGDVSVWSITGDVMWSTKNKGTVGFYLLGGLGAYYVDAKLTNSVWVPGWGCSWYWCYPGFWPANEIIGSTSNWEWGYNAGVGVTFNLASDSQIFIEGKYHWIQSEDTGEYIPIVVGYRW